MHPDPSPRPTAPASDAPAPSVVEQILTDAEPPARVDGVVVGVLAEVANGVRVRHPYAPGPVAARSAAALTEADVGAEVALLFENGDTARPIVVGRMWAPSAGLAVEADGTRVHLRAEREVLIECGKSSIRLSADGRVVIRGEEVISRARKANKVRGGAVHIN